LLGFGTVDGSLMAVQNLGPTRIARLIRTFFGLFTLDVTRPFSNFWAVIVSYRDKRTREFAAGKRAKAVSGFERSARLKLDRMEAATSLRDLSALPWNRFEALVGDRKRQYSIRINDQWRICFEWADRSPGLSNVEIVDYH
jgi:proteic killer suppression protein